MQLAATAILDLTAVPCRVACERGRDAPSSVLLGFLAHFEGTRAVTAPLELAMARYATGDDAALGEVYDLAAPHVFRFLSRLARDPVLAEDLTQEVFLRVHGARASYRVDAKVLPWMFTIGRRLFLDAVRARRHDGPSLDADDRPSGPDVVPAISQAPRPDELVVEVHLRIEVERILATLPEHHATAYRLLKEENLTAAEAAAVLGTTENGVKLRAHRAYEALRRILGETWLDEPGSRGRGETRGAAVDRVGAT
jgi:RNA polymerase sigma-70 factor (ECF subfamily)